MGKKPEELGDLGGIGERQAEQGVPSNQSLKTFMISGIFSSVPWPMPLPGFSWE